MKVDLKWFSGPDEPEEICGEAAALCYKSKNPGSALRSALRMGHESVLEHASFTFVIEGISRVALAQLTRHRLCSFSVVSQRYTGIEGQRFVIPETIKNTIVNQCDNYLADIWNNAIDTILSAYSAFIIAGIPEEDARYIIPQGITCDLIMTANARQLRHILGLRQCNRAQWEIRKMADMMHKELNLVAPGLFEDCGPACSRGERCPEGKKSCGHPRTKSECGGVNEEK